jgi:GntR family transcriptional regulator
LGKSTSRTVPFYHQVAETLRDRISTGAYEIGSCLPSSPELEREFSVSNITIRKALNLLKQEGRIKTQLGVGTVVTSAGEREVVDIKFSGKFTEWLEWASGRAQDVRQEVLSVGRERASSEIRAKLNLQDGETVWQMRRLRLLHGEPISYHVSYGRDELSKFIKKKHLQGSGSFIEQLQQHYPRKVVRIEQRVEAAIANIDLAKLLGIDFGSPIFFMEHLYIGEHGEVIAMTQLFMRADRYRYSTSIDVGANGLS